MEFFVEKIKYKVPYFMVLLSTMKCLHEKTIKLVLFQNEVMYYRLLPLASKLMKK